MSFDATNTLCNQHHSTYIFSLIFHVLDLFRLTNGRGYEMLCHLYLYIQTGFCQAFYYHSHFKRFGTFNERGKWGAEEMESPFLKEREDKKTQKKREDRKTQKDRYPTWNVKDCLPSAKFSNTITTFLLGKRPKFRLDLVQSLILSLRLIDSLVKKSFAKIIRKKITLATLRPWLFGKKTDALTPFPQKQMLESLAPITDIF